MLTNQAICMSSTTTTMRTVGRINRLPRELLTEIFASSLPVLQEEAIEVSDLSFREIPPRNLASVCRHWREIVQSTQDLWTRWTFSLAQPIHARIATHFMRECLDRSGNKPISLVVHLSRHQEGQIEESFFRVLLSTQTRWKAAHIEAEYQSFSLDCTQLALAPLSSLRVSHAVGELMGIAEAKSLDRLKVLRLWYCHPSYLKLLPLAPNLEELHVLDIDTDSDAVLPPICFKRLRHLAVAGQLLESFTCPTLLSLDLGIIPHHQVESFIHRSQPPLLSLKMGCSSKVDCIAIIRLLPQLTSLSIFSETVQHILEGLSNRKPDDGDFELCPLLQVVTLMSFLSIEAWYVVRFIESRWRSPNRSIRGVHIKGAITEFSADDDPSTLTGAWEPLAEFIREGLVFSTSK